MFEVRSGDSNLKNDLQVMLHEKGSKETGLEEFLVIIDETEKSYGSWWVALDEDEEPRVALSVNYLNDLSYVRAIWTRSYSISDSQEASKKLLREWVESSKHNVTKFQADLPVYSPFVDGLIETGFRKQKILRVTYSVRTEWYAEELPELYTMRPVHRDELPAIYDKLIGPDFEPGSPLYVRKGDFLNFVKSLPDTAFSSWVVVIDDKSEMVGFAGSFLSMEKKSPIAVTYGPHSKEPLVTRAIIGEMLSYWRSNNIDKLRILRTKEFHPNIIDQFKMELIFESIRFMGDKNKLIFKT